MSFCVALKQVSVTTFACWFLAQEKKKNKKVILLLSVFFSLEKEEISVYLHGVQLKNHKNENLFMRFHQKVPSFKRSKGIHIVQSV